MTGATFVPQQILEEAAMLAWTASLGALTPEALAEREDVSAKIASGRLDDAVQRRLLKRESVLVGYSSLYTVTSKGRNLARRYAHAGEYVYPNGLRTPVVSIKEARHMIACAGVRAALERRHPGHRVIGEVELHRDEREGGRRLASVEIGGVGRRRSHFPDIVIWPPGTLDDPDTPSPSTSASAPPALPVAVEVELTSKSKEELVENLRAWARCRTIEAVIYFAETRKIEEKLLDLIEELKVEEEIVVNPLSEILKPQPGFPLIDE
jgi:hypothetical protein